jgi:hypothetical protein
VKELVSLFVDRFPESDCTIQDSREPEIFNGATAYWVLMKDKRFENEFTVKKLFPYIYRGADELLYGWTDWQNVFDNAENPIHYDDWQVIGVHNKAGGKE